MTPDRIYIKLETILEYFLAHAVQIMSFPSETEPSLRAELEIYSELIMISLICRNAGIVAKQELSLVGAVSVGF